MSTRYTAAERLDYVRSLPRQRMVASLVALSDGRLLIVKPAYRDGWLLPGGVVDQDESPARACIREAHEELGLHLSLDRLALVDHAADPGDGSGGSVHFWFTTAELSPLQVEAIEFPSDELEEYRLVTPEAAVSMLVSRLAGRLEAYINYGDAACTVYTENGRPIILGADGG